MRHAPENVILIGMKHHVTDWLVKLPDKDCMVVARHFELNSHDNATLQALSKDISVNASGKLWWTHRQAGHRTQQRVCKGKTGCFRTCRV